MTQKNERLEKLKDICLQCRGCTLGSSRKKMVFGEGNPDAPIMFVGEAPGQTEDETGRPFVGRSGRLLRDMIAAIGYADRVFIVNILKCRPPNNRPPELDEISVCIRFLKKQIEIIQPKCIVLLGRTAVKGMIVEHSAMPLDSLRLISKDWIITYGDIPLLVTYHPSALLRDPARRFGASEDFKFIQSQGF